MRIGVLGLQGAVSEHILSTDLALNELGIEGTVSEVRETTHLEDLDGIILPGGESTTISGLSHTSGITNQLRNSDLPILATCAGMILAGTSCDGPQQELIKRIDMHVTRNAFGTQRESFETRLNLKHIRELPAVFIRAPIIETLHDRKAKAIAEFDGKIVGAKKGKTIAVSFHPELTSDLRVHKMFLKSIK